MALKLLNLKYEFNKYDSMKMRDFIHDASQFKSRSNTFKLYNKEHVVYVLKGLFENAERDKLVPVSLLIYSTKALRPTQDQDIC